MVPVLNALQGCAGELRRIAGLRGLQLCQRRGRAGRGLDRDSQGHGRDEREHDSHDSLVKRLLVFQKWQVFPRFFTAWVRSEPSECTKGNIQTCPCTKVQHPDLSGRAILAAATTGRGESLEGAALDNIDRTVHENNSTSEKTYLSTIN